DIDIIIKSFINRFFFTDSICYNPCLLFIIIQVNIFFRAAGCRPYVLYALTPLRHSAETDSLLAQADLRQSVTMN
ncbi:MAG: hypothetical protein FWH53_08075, partial [Leptospirales bacterium]|nr:hypothetical protein [Leptospirales bacterium]